MYTKKSCWKCGSCRKKQDNKTYNADGKEIEDYLDQTNENDYADYPKLSSMSAFDREERIKELWHKAYAKAKGAAVILSTFEGLRTKI
jgi:hypothetical protein